MGLGGTPFALTSTLGPTADRSKNNNEEALGDSLRFGLGIGTSGHQSEYSGHEQFYAPVGLNKAMLLSRSPCACGCEARMGIGRSRQYRVALGLERRLLRWKFNVHGPDMGSRLSGAARPGNHTRIAERIDLAGLVLSEGVAFLYTSSGSAKSSNCRDYRSIRFQFVEFGVGNLYT
jgi:hypothetical protein